MVATLVATTVVSGVGAVPWLERADSDGDGTEELGVEWNSLAGEAGAATASGTAGLSCPAGMVLDGDLCKTPKVHTVPVTLTCAQPGYVLVSTVGELGTSHSCQKTVPAHCTGAKVLHQGQCQTETTEQRDANWSCVEGTLVSTFVDPGYVYSCRIAIDPPECPESGESYLTTPSAGCYVEVSFHQTQDYTWTCTEGTLVTNAGDHGVARSCKVTLASLTCPDGETYRNSRCEEERTFYRTRGYEWTCSSGTLVTTSGEHGVARSCKVTLSPPQCPNGETWRNNRCEKQQTYYDSRPYDYSCPSGYTLGTSGLTRTCTKTETYRKRVCSYDPLAGQQCWWENRTRTLTAAVRQTCPSGFSSDGTGCTADSPSVRWVATGSSPTRFRYDPATKSCISGYSPAGSVCQADSPSTRWAATGSSPTRFRYDPATKSCISGWSDNGSLCQSDTASKRWVATGSTPTRLRYDPATKSCPSGWSDNGNLCQSDTASTRWDVTTSTPITSRTANAVRSCDTDFAWNDTSGKCEKTTYADPTAPLTKLVGDPPVVSCRDGYKLAGGGRCSKTTLGDPTAVPIGADCITDLGTLGAGAVSRSGTLATGCTSLRRGDTQSPHYARRFSLRVPAASVATFTASSSAADVFLYVLSGSGSNVTEVASDDDSGTGTDAQVTGVALAAGTTYTIEVTTSAANATGAFSLSGTIALKEPPVVITGLADGTGWGLAAATVTASDGFTVEPTDASCTATTATAGVTPSVSSGTVAGERTVSLALAAPFSHEATVSCDATGRTAAEATATLAGKVAISTVTVAAGDSCTGTSAAGYACTVPGDGTLSVTATAQGAHNGLSLAWTATGGVSVAAPTQTAVAPTPGVGFSRTSTAALACTADGTVTVTVSAGGVTETAAVSVTCDIAVACNDPLGELAPGDTARSGTISADADCVSEVRGAEQAWRVHYVRRHTFTLVGDATVTIDVGSAATPKLDTWLILFKGRTAEGTPVAQDGHSGPGTDSRIARKLAAGDYTIEATTFFSRAGGDYDLNVNTRYDKQVTITGLVGATKTGSGQVGFARPFTVAPAGAECTPGPDTAAVTKGSGPGDRTLSASIGSPGSLQVTVTCETAGYVAASQTVTLTAQLACSTHLGTLTPGITTHSGGLWGGNPCRSPQRFTDGGNSITRYAHRHTFTVTSPGWVTIDLESAAGNRTPLDTYLILLKGHSPDGTGTVAGRDDDSGTGSNSRLSSIKLAPGDYTVEATTDKYLRTGDYDLTINARLDVGIHGLNGNAIIGTGTVADHFTVAPADAACTPSTGTVTAGENGRRVLTATLTALGTTTVTVTCTHTGYRTATATSTLRALKPVASVEIDASAGGTCKPFAGTLDPHVDQAFACTMAQSTALTVGAVASGASPRMSLTWTSDDSATVAPADNGLDVSVIGSSVVFARSGTGTIRCTADADVTLNVRIGGAVEHTTALKIDCKPPVEITNYIPGTRNGPGPMTGTFDVAPSTAQCTARHLAGITGQHAAAAGTGTSRTVSVTTTATGALDVEVKCSNDGYADSTATATFRANDEAACTTGLGTLWHGSTSRTGTLSAASCTSAKRTPASATFYAHRYTFTMATAGWATIDLVGTGTGADKLDTYAVVLYGHGSGGVERASDDDSGGNGDARLADVLLAAGKYTIEATTATNEATGAYRLRVQADFAARTPDQPRHVLATVGQQITRTWSHQPADVSVSIQSVTPAGLDAQVRTDDGSATFTATATHAGVYTVTVAYTASGHTSTITTTVDADCPPRYVETNTRTCTPLATALPTACTVTSLHDGRIWGRRDQSGQYLLYSRSADEDCGSLTQDNKAVYYAFSLPKRLPVEFELRDVINMATLRAGGAPSMTLWSVRSTHPVTGRVVGFEATARTTSSSGPFVGLDLAAGDYLIEIAPSRAVSPAFEESWFKIRTDLPTAERTYADVKLVGNTGLDGAGMT
ncbi:MAG: hypothetical protein F4070_09665, partial [Acidimicrobiales bacterium]|nr:hypothetical protein [Acidimicrobiales bacterium]